MNLKDGARKCCVHNCTNTTDQGQFVGDVCVPCHKFITLGTGTHSQAYRNGANLFVKTMNMDITDAVDDLKKLLDNLQRK